MANFRNLIVWQKTDELAYQVYKSTEAFPTHETFGLVLQLKRAALSIPTNIVEGYNRKSKKELHRYIDIALGSLTEVEYLILFAKKLNYIENNIKEIDGLIAESGKLLWSFQKKS